MVIGNKLTLPKFMPNLYTLTTIHKYAPCFRLWCFIVAGRFHSGYGGTYDCRIKDGNLLTNHLLGYYFNYFLSLIMPFIKSGHEPLMKRLFLYSFLTFMSFSCPEQLVGCEMKSVSAFTTHIDTILPPPDNISST